MIADGYTDVPSGRIAAVVTYLEMLAPPPLSLPPPSLYKVRRVEKPDLNWYRTLFKLVGEQWLWFSRLRMSDDELASIIHDPRVDVFALSADGEDKGLLELDRRPEGEVELAFLGVTDDLVGQGAGRLLMHHALTEAWRHAPRRVFVHTCTLDHPKALGFYIKAGFKPYRRAIEIAPDPRLTDDAPVGAAPQIPLISDRL